MLLNYGRHKVLQLRRLYRKSFLFAFILIGAALVAVSALGFSYLVSYAATLNETWVKQYPWTLLIGLPFGFMLLTVLTRRLAPYTAGSGIPQVMASLYEQDPKKKGILVSFWPTLLKIPLTFFALVLGASVGREGPTVQVGAAMMWGWGKLCDRFYLTRFRFKKNELLAIGAAGGLAAAFNAPLAGIIFAIEELSRTATLKWDRHIIVGILAAGFILVAIEGDNPNFPIFTGGASLRAMFWGILIIGIVCGILGGLFSKLLIKGLPFFLPGKIKSWVQHHPIWISGIMGLLVAMVGLYFEGATLGIGYQHGADGLRGVAGYEPGLMLGKFSVSLFSYWAGIPGGIFTPSLSIGALLGTGLHHLHWVLGMNQEVVVLFCMASFLAAVTQSPLTSSVIVMEMTLSSPMLFWLLIYSLVATFVAKQFSPRSFYLVSAIRYINLLRVLETPDKAKKKG